VSTGQPDPSVTFNEGDIYGIIAQALDIEYAGRKDYAHIVRGWTFTAS
jgi:hypothetical protein